MSTKTGNPKAKTIGSAGFEPNEWLDAWDTSKAPLETDFASAIRNAFGLNPKDNYVYHAVASVTLAQVQVAIDHEDENGMHAWYRDEGGAQITAPSKADIDAYTAIFSPLTVTTKALSAFTGNAKKGSLRASVAQHLQSNLHLPTQSSSLVLPNKQKKASPNPALDFWTWSCINLEWAGPNADTVNIKQSHHMLPVFYHHFGCVCPTYDAISLITQLSRPPSKMKGEKAMERPVLDIGSGNGYWTLMLRRAGLTVYPIDNAVSVWRTMWIPDTLPYDGIELLTAKTMPKPLQDVRRGGEGAILLLVYPQVSNNFTAKVIDAYKGDVIVVAGTQNGNGFTGFAGETIASWMAREKREFELVLQIPLPSFAGKDEALFVFMKRSPEVEA